MKDSYQITNFPIYVSMGCKEKLDCYCQKKKPGTVIIFKITSGPETGKIKIVQITQCGVRSIDLTNTSISSKLTRALNYSKMK